MPRLSRAGLLLFIALTLVPAASIGARGEGGTNSVQENDDATVLHVLNRVAYGPRPGDIARVKAMGVKAYIEQQLSPEKIADPAVDQALAGFDTLTMSTQELSEKYYRPLDQMKRRIEVVEGEREALAQQHETWRREFEGYFVPRPPEIEWSVTLDALKTLGIL